MIKLLKFVVLLSVVTITSYSCSKVFMVVSSPPHQPTARKVEPHPGVALVLGGGAFHGMAHVGVIKVLEDAGVPIDLIVGTSAGSMVGAMYASYPHIDSLLPLVKSTTAKDVFDFSLFRSSEGFVSGKKLQNYIKKNIKVTEIEETVIPFVAVTSDIEKGKTVASKAGPIGPSVNASSAIPGIFEPVKMYGTTFVDGGILDNVATDVAKEYNPKLIIAVNIMEMDTVAELKNYKQVVLRAYHVAIHKLTGVGIADADIVIAPDLSSLPLLSSKDNQKMYEIGVNAAKKMLPLIKKELKEKGVNLR
jgi:NTE family protein